MFQDILLVVSSRTKMAGSTTWPVSMGSTRCTETSVANQSALLNNPQNRRSQLHRCRCLCTITCVILYVICCSQRMRFKTSLRGMRQYVRSSVHRYKCYRQTHTLVKRYKCWTENLFWYIVYADKHVVCYPGGYKCCRETCTLVH
jgi:hypothetical protein